jgi:hypothetical protein
MYLCIYVFMYLCIYSTPVPAVHTYNAGAGRIRVGVDS